MSARWTTPTRLPNGGLRFIPPPTDGHAAGVVIIGGILVFIGFGTFATVQKLGIEAMNWQFFTFLGGLVAVWLGLLLGIVFPLGITLTDGRIGLARNLFGRLVWKEWRPTEKIGRLVIRHSGENSPGALVAGCDGEPIMLAEKREQEDLRVVANELTAALGGVAVSNEETGFTETRTEQPVLSRLRADGDTIRLPAVAVVVQRPVTEVRRFGPEFRQRLKWYALWAFGLGWLFLYAGLGLGLTLWSSGEIIFNGRTSGHVSIAGQELPHSTPLPDLPSRLSAVAVSVLYAAVIDVPLLVLGLWLGRRLIRSVRRTAAPAPVNRTVVIRNRPRPATIALTANALAVSHGSVESCWTWSDVVTVHAQHEVHESESGTDVIEWLEIRLRSGEVWKLFGTDGADWEWLATRARAAGPPEPAPLTVG